MTDTHTVDGTAALEQKIDALAAQVDLLVAEAAADRRRRVALEELRVDLTPIAVTAVERSAVLLEEHPIDPAELMRLAARVAENARVLESVLIQLESMASLVNDVKPLVGPGVERAIELAGSFEDKGYFEFGSAAAGVVDQIVTNYSREDVESLGDNVVQILDVVKDLTQPEVLAVAQRVLDAVHRQALVPNDPGAPPPSLFALAGRLRDPEIRRGLGRALDTVAAVAADSPESPTSTTSTQGGV